MEWGEKSLDLKEIEVCFAILNEQHDVIVREIRRIIDEFTESMYYVADEPEKKKAAQTGKKVVAESVRKNLVSFLPVAE
eukprot:CAMPEP_0185574658 /NCGR_PEP_ID=MMETSP0434-20130131/6072_1 /TAXON_ID=626734 ORGANISM="Favella taraikaensis, Strain Fe Narragansett Bay" /NCGR_SAMPLE_ID=MMETSP0434 /ASSEMBLY_ACC=CAM_ASM_000379 /LENGTH=78 /DNA_ID=CAMNT_0028191307 /DNA_START=574 /DNA_END=810 /DNA_ORIENTATION=+